jgi:hypothetical protein
MSKSELIQEIVEPSVIDVHVEKDCPVNAEVNFNDGEQLPPSSKFDFRALPLCLASRNQLANLYDYAWENGVPDNKRKLLDLIVANAFVSGRGIYVPVSPRVKLAGKHPDYSEPFSANKDGIPTYPGGLA